MQRDRQQRLSVNQAHDLGCVSKKDHSSNEEIQNHMNLIFVHVPKCGGTTIIDTLSNLSKRPLHIDRYISEFHQWVRGGHKITWNQYMQIESIQNKITQHLF